MRSPVMVRPSPSSSSVALDRDYELSSAAGADLEGISWQARLSGAGIAELIMFAGGKSLPRDDSGRGARREPGFLARLTIAACYSGLSGGS